MATVLGGNEGEKLMAVARSLRKGVSMDDMKLFGCDPWHAVHATGTTTLEAMGEFLEGLAARLGNEVVNPQVGD